MPCSSNRETSSRTAMASSGKRTKTTSEPPSLAATPIGEQPGASSDGEHRQQPALSSNISKRRRDQGEDNDAVSNGQQSPPPSSLFFGQQQRLHVSSRRITERALKLRPTTLNTKKQAKSFRADDLSGGLGWKPFLYFSIRYCKNGSSCRFLHDAGPCEGEVGLPSKFEMMEHCQELLKYIYVCSPAKTSHSFSAHDFF
ncbi:hypothetical protein KY289_001160 [Solanum tuberosum]|nr:hypothetical protein KY289_001160 [Solanum tuberosum]